MRFRKNLKKVLQLSVLMGLCFCLAPSKAHAQEAQHIYENRFLIMLDYSINMNEYVRRRLQDRRLSAYAQKMAETNAREAEQMTPPSNYSNLHPHFLLVLGNVERAFYHASKGQMDRYRHHQKIIRTELNILENLALRAGINLNAKVF